MEINLENSTIKNGTPEDLLSRSRKYFVKNETDEEMFTKEKKEHPEFSDSQIHQIVQDHKREKVENRAHTPIVSEQQRRLFYYWKAHPSERPASISEEVLDMHLKEVEHKKLPEKS